MKRREPAVGAIQHRGATGATAVEGARIIRFVASNENVDRYGDIVRASGWDLNNYRANPVVLFSHQSRSLPIGKAVDIKVSGTELVADAEFMTADLSPEADTIYRMVKAGFLNAVSVGFKPTKKPNRILDANNEWTGGYEFVGQDLFEFSVVPIPALPSALAVSRSFQDADTYYRELERIAPGATALVDVNRSRVRIAELRLAP